MFFRYKEEDVFLDMQLNKITVLFNWREAKTEKKKYDQYFHDRSGAFYFLLNDRLYLTDHSI